MPPAVLGSRLDITFCDAAGTENRMYHVYLCLAVDLSVYLCLAVDLSVCLFVCHALGCSAFCPSVSMPV